MMPVRLRHNPSVALSQHFGSSESLHGFAQAYVIGQDHSAAAPRTWQGSSFVFRIPFRGSM
jgi:hypothetical protein